MSRKNKPLNEDIVNDIETEVIDNSLKNSIIQPKIKTETCKILWIKSTHNTFAIDFKGYGITLNGNIDSSTKNIDIEYQSEIGNPDFKVINY